MNKAVSVPPARAHLEARQCVRVSMASEYRAGWFGLVVETYPQSPEYVGLLFGRNRQLLPVVSEFCQDDIQAWHVDELDLSSVVWTAQ